MFFRVKLNDKTIYEVEDKKVDRNKFWRSYKALPIIYVKNNLADFNLEVLYF